MRLHKGIGLLAALFATASAMAQAQVAPGAITFAVEATSASNGTVTPRATWSTSPVADSCVGEGGWTGTKGASGTETLPPVTQGAMYKITCTWSSAIAKISWTPPTLNTDNTPLTDLKGVSIRYGTTTRDKKMNVEGGANSVPIGPLAPGTYTFTASAYNTAGAESQETGPVSYTAGTATGAKSVTLAVNIPMPVTDLTVK